MLRSMTGFGAASSEGAKGNVRVEVRSVNHRHILVKVRTPSEFSSLENEIERLVKKKLERGSISVYVHASKPSASASVTVDHELAGRYRKDLAKLAGELGITDDLSLSSIVSLPGVMATQEEETSALESRTRLVRRLSGEALANLVEMRETEGVALRADMHKHAAAIAKTVARIEKRMPQVVKGHQKNLKARVEELLGNGRSVEPADLAREIALLADRLDTSEEISRLASHLKQLDKFLDKGGAIGRKLEFLVQEIFREVNTIGSKCSDAKVAHWVVDAKTHAERLREQVQNVE